MAEDPLKKYWEKRAQEIPHYKPAHETQTVRMPPDFSSIPNGPGPATRHPGREMMDVSAQLKARMMQQAVMGGGDNKIADLTEGYPYYTSLATGSFGHAAPLFKSAGVIKGATAKGVTVKKEIAGYVVDNMSSVDMSKMNEGNPNIQKTLLVEVSVPFLGNFLVPKEAVVYRGSGPMGDGRKLLKG